MSRIGKLPIEIPQWVDITIDWRRLTVKWPKGHLEMNCVDWVDVLREENKILVSVKDDLNKKFWWLTRTLINNMVLWVTEWYSKKLHILWVWFNVKVQWKSIVLNLWYSHPVKYDLPDGISAVAEKDPKWSDILTISGIDKQKVWEVTAKIKTFRMPEPYKGKWIRYLGEKIKIKAWKTAKK